jgi:hypothetical protein
VVLGAVARLVARRRGSRSETMGAALAVPA